jgi:hypothetical protein
MPKKALKMNQAAAPIAEEPASSNATVTEIPVTEKNAKCLKLFVQLVARKLPFHLSLLVRDRYTVGTVSKLGAVVN